MARQSGLGHGRRAWVGLFALLTSTSIGGAGFARAAERVTPEPAAAPECKSAGVKVTFTRGSDELDTNGRGALASVATWLQNGEQRSVRLEGYADRRGGATGNQRLSERRAQAARDFLTGRGIDRDRIMVFGHGEAPEHPELTGADARVVLVTVCDVPKELATEIPAPPAPPPPAAEPVTPPPPASAPAPHAAMVPPPAPAPPPDPAPARPASVPAPAPPAPPPPFANPGPASGLGVEATLGGGAIGFIDQAPRSVAGTGASWEARLMFGSRLPVAVETAYLGSVQNVDALGVSNSSLLLGNGIEGTLRVNLTRRRLQPYLFGGAGWTHYQLANTTTNTSSVLGKDDVGTIPMGAGLSVRLGDSFIIDARGTYRATFNDDLMRGTATSGNSMQSWNASARAGFEF